MAAHGLKPVTNLSNDKRFSEKLEDVVGLYLNSSCREKSQIQALDRTQPGLLEEGSVWHLNPRLQTQRNHHDVRRPHWTARWGPACRSIGIRNGFGFLIRSNA